MQHGRLRGLGEWMLEVSRDGRISPQRRPPDLFGKSLGSTLFSVLLALGGCVRNELPNPVVVHADGMPAWFGYEAAVMTARTLGYSVRDSDPEHSRLRVCPPAQHGALPTDVRRTAQCFDIQAWSGGVDIQVTGMEGQRLDEASRRRLGQQMEQLAWGVAQRTRTWNARGEMLAEPRTPNMVPVMVPPGHFDSR